MDLIVCVGDHCHLNGSEMVVRTFQELLAESDLGGRVTLKGSFCCGRCTPGEGVAVRIEEDYFHTRYEDAETCFQNEIHPRLRERLAGSPSSGGV